MKMKFLPGTTASLLNDECDIVCEVEVDSFIVNEKAYKVWYTFKQTGERQSVKVPEWKLVECPKKPLFG